LIASPAKEDKRLIIFRITGYCKETREETGEREVEQIPYEDTPALKTA